MWNPSATMPAARFSTPAVSARRLNPTEKDGQGHIIKISLDGNILTKAFLPANGQMMNKPKGNFIADGHLWVTDIDSVWEFDLKTKARPETRRFPASPLPTIRPS